MPRAPDAIELRHLRAFVAVADELNFGRAASRLFISQPALSRQIRSLERLVGCDLLRRSTHRVELTLAGDALLNRARRLLVDVDGAVFETRAVGGELERRLAEIWEPVSDLTAADPDLQALRDAGEQLHAQFEPVTDIAVRPANAGGVPATAAVAPVRCSAATVLLLARRRLRDGVRLRLPPLCQRPRGRRRRVRPGTRLPPGAGAPVPGGAGGRRARVPVDDRRRDRSRIGGRGRRLRPAEG